MLTHVRPAWQQLQEYYKSSAPSIVVKDLFSSDKDRFSKFSRKFDGKDGRILFDYSKNIVDDKSYELLLQLAKQANVFGLRDRLFAGEHINITEDRHLKIPIHITDCAAGPFSIPHCAMSQELQ
jgi:glucose-6-phosphate isomerase